MKWVRRILIVMLAIAIGAMFYIARYHIDSITARSAQSVTLLSRTHSIDRIYQSMQGPYSNHSEIKLVDSKQRQLLWVTGLTSQLVAKDGTQPMSREFFCHSNLVFSPEKIIPSRAAGKEFTSSQDGRLFTLIPGSLAIELPAGFGVPIYSDEALDYFSMSLNLNEKNGSRDVRFKTDVHFVSDDQTKTEMKPLFRRALYGFEPIGMASPHTMCMGGDHPGASCGPFVGKAASNSFVASLGKTNTIHWMIPPGKYESHVPVNDQLDLPYDTTVHFVTGHLHPFGKSLELFDKTENKSVFIIQSEDFNGKLGVAKMDQISSIDGVALFHDHHYELITKYMNPTKQPIDVMSILYLYARDKTFESQHAPAPSWRRRLARLFD